ncbi:shikimate dehydrogenase [Pullulanibacillus sp. KACC 23026]|uniref:shikimate dehydrogenase family protein n=1 Tax=Pullulanibacillus sp. KACC 23026 TaxID=3028315 RepID=UPI0023AEDB20|nr:shikimate dehydrogenase [Pullulanibacillus sp. KACC 23026]WEG13365.1 shikimate dehydrogenase [Pullulanibacillus sp. KACC 23026]
MNLPDKAIQPTMYFIGVTTTQSSIMKLFPLWAEVLGLKNAVLKGIDLDIHANPQDYRDVVKFIKNDELSLGALVTTHKIDLYNAAKDLFDYFDPYAMIFGELSSISKLNGKLEGYAKDPISSGLAMESFIPKDYWKEHQGELFIMGSGGSAIAICSYLLDPNNGDNIPTRVVVSDLNQSRLDEIEKIIKEINPNIEAEYYITLGPEQNDANLSKLKPNSLIINATGLGKDRPGSPLTKKCVFPNNSLVWELNYRGERDFMHQAIAQQEEKGLQVEDGWNYFIHGWTQVIAEVFHIEITEDQIKEISELSSKIR